jgi:hypothetical protein
MQAWVVSTTNRILKDFANAAVIPNRFGQLFRITETSLSSHV